jgi:hypothetical protein
VTKAVVISASSHQAEVIELKDPVVAALLAWLVPGLGHLYQGRVAKGVLFGVCILGIYLFGLYISSGRAVYASWTENDKRLYYLCQVWVGLPALPAMLQTYLVRHGKEPLLGGVMAPHKNPGELNEWYRTLNSYLDLGTVYTTIAGLLNVLVIYDAWGGPVQFEEEEKKRKGPNESDEPAKE